jgi:hypothetical protein
MKRIILFSVGLMMMTTAVFADNDKPVTVDQLPASARQFVEKYFPNVKVSFAKMETEMFDKSYKVVFADGSKVEFDKKGEWTDVDCKFTQVPAGIVPQQIVDYVAANYSDAKILDIDRDKHDYEVSLSNRLELKFDLKFNLIGIDD